MLNDDKLLYMPIDIIHWTECYFKELNDIPKYIFGFVFNFVFEIESETNLANVKRIVFSVRCSNTSQKAILYKQKKARRLILRQARKMVP